MYLINVLSMKIEFFQTERDIEYAILSHRWQEDEVLFHDLQSGHAQQKKGYKKLEAFCKTAAHDGFTYVWCDMCCIDKSSSAELSESINSMFRWYQNAAVCYAYLADVTTNVIEGDTSDFNDSEWFERGWCLQELLAPRTVGFFNHDWKYLGTKAEHSQLISEITGIRREAICGRDLDKYSIAQRMSWAADRETTRSEDIAYSLLGIFGVNMPLLYGEGERAFIRLQQEIIRESSDQSILVYSENGPSQPLLARSPSAFRDSSQIICSDIPLTGEQYSLTNMGLSMEVMLHPWTLDTYFALIDCRDERRPYEQLGIFLRLQPQIVSKEGIISSDHALRVKVNGKSWTSTLSTSSLRARIYIENKDSGTIALPTKRYGYWIRNFEGSKTWAKNGKLWALSWKKLNGYHYWYELNETERVLEIPEEGYETVRFVQLTRETEPLRSIPDLPIFLRLGFSMKFEPVIALLNGNHRIRPNTSDLRFYYGEGLPPSDADVIFRGTNRSTTVKGEYRWPSGNRVKINCEKLVTEVVEMWALDIWPS